MKLTEEQFDKIINTVWALLECDPPPQKETTKYAIEQILTPAAPPRSAEEWYEDKTYHSRIEHIKAYIKKWLLDAEDLPKDGNLPSQLWIEDVTELIDTYASQLRNELDEVKDERETMIRAFCEIREEFENRTWLMEGRGSYPFNDDRYRQEVRYIMDAFNNIEKKMWKQIKSKTHEYRNEIQSEFRKEVTDEEVLILKDWLDFSKDVTCGDFAGDDWLGALRHKTKLYLEKVMRSKITVK